MLGTVEHYAFQYYGIDWIIMLTVFSGIFLLGDKKRQGFILGTVSSVFGIVFSFQIGSIANAIASAVLLGLYLRGYFSWQEERA